MSTNQMHDKISKRTYRTLGILTWLAITCTAGAAIDQSIEESRDARRSASLREAFSAALGFGKKHENAIDPTGSLRRFDPVFSQASDQSWHQVGYVSAIHSIGNNKNSLRIAWFDRELSLSDATLTLYRNDGNLEEVVKMMLPQGKRQRIQEMLGHLLESHGHELTKAFAPVIEDTIRHSLPVIEDELRSSISRHRTTLEHLGDRYNNRLLERRLVPLARNHVMPIVRKHGQSTAEKIGREVWDRASIWRFAWRAVYDKAPLTEDRLVQEEWDRFVHEEAIPVLESHTDEIVGVVGKVLAETTRDAHVRSVLTAVVDEIAADPEVRSLALQILKETLVDNDRLHQVWADLWQSDQAKAAIDLASKRLEPVIREIGDELFGTQDEGIDPMFALVLRNQIFGKDRRWIVAKSKQPLDDDSSIPAIQIAPDTMIYPIVHIAQMDPQSSVERSSNASQPRESAP